MDTSVYDKLRKKPCVCVNRSPGEERTTISEWLKETDYVIWMKKVILFVVVFKRTA